MVVDFGETKLSPSKNSVYVLSLYIKRGKLSVRNVRAYIRNGGRGQLSSE